MKTLEERFWEKVNKNTPNGCWLWTGCVVVDAYGTFRKGTKMVYAHRMSWKLHKGVIPKGLFVLHKCDVRHCVNPDHLWLGSKKDNNQDMLKKRRHYSQTHAHMPRLTKEEVQLIRREYSDGATRAQLANKFLVNWQTIRNIVRRRTRKNI